MEGCTDPTPLEEVAKSAEEAVLGNEGAAGSALEESVNGGVIVKEEVNGKVPTVCSQGEGPDGSTELSCLLGDNPRGTREEAYAHGGLPNTNVICTPRRAGSVSIVSGVTRQRRGSTTRSLPSWQAHGRGLKGGTSELGRHAGQGGRAKAESSIGACKKGVNAAAGLC